MSPMVLPFPITSGSFSGTRRSDAHPQAVARVVIPGGCFQIAWYTLDMGHFYGYFFPSGRTPWLTGRLATVPARDDTQRCHHTRWGSAQHWDKAKADCSTSLRTRPGTWLLQSIHSHLALAGQVTYTHKPCTWRRWGWGFALFVKRFIALWIIQTAVAIWLYLLSQPCPVAQGENHFLFHSRWAAGAWIRSLCTYTEF